MDSHIHNENDEELNEFKKELDEFSQNVYDTHLRRYDHVANAINTEKIEGVTLGDLKKEFSDKIKAHVDTKGENVHKINPQTLILT